MRELSLRNISHIMPTQKLKHWQLLMENSETREYKQRDIMTDD